MGDPTLVELDAFAKRHTAGMPVPTKDALKLVCQDNAEYAQSPYEVDVSDPVIKGKSGQSQPAPNRASRFRKG